MTIRFHEAIHCNECLKQRRNIGADMKQKDIILDKEKCFIWGDYW